jgi:signal peptidase I
VRDYNFPDGSVHSSHDVVIEEKPLIQLKKSTPLWIHTLSYFRTSFVFFVLLTIYFFLEDTTFVQSYVAGGPNGSILVYLPLIMLLITSTTFLFFSMIADFSRETKPENPFIYFVTYLLILILFPVFLIYRLLIKPLRKSSETTPTIFNKFIAIQLIGAILFISMSLYVLRIEWRRSFEQSGTVLGQRLGILPEPIPIAGTGSMYPTFPKGEEKDPKAQAQELVATAGMLPFPSGFSFLGFSFGDSTIKRGDIVSFSNSKTEEITEQKYGDASGLIKRVIGLPGDKIELRSGILYINEQPQKETYIAKARSTFGGEFMPECEEKVVPDNELFVLGDNRTASNDSRHEVGFIKISDVDHLLPYEKQIGVVDSLWHDATNDLSEAAKISINRTEILKLINEERQKNGAEPLKYNAKLDTSAKLRGQKMLAFDDFTTEAEKSGYSLTKALADAKYTNIVYGEFYVQGYFEADELIENLVEFPKTVEFLSKKDYQEIGFSEVQGDLNGCPSQVIVFHLGGYVAPNYSADDINGWQSSLDNLKGIAPGWADLRLSGRFYEENKADVDRINTLISTSITSLESIVAQMKANQWLNVEHKEFAERQDAVYAEIDSLTKSLNERTKNF